jgi:hypothetical protein
MNWHQHPDLLDRLAAEYALGTLHGGARRRFEAVMQAHPDVARAAARWHERLAPMDADLPPLPAGDALWARIEQRAFGAASAEPAAPSASAGQRHRDAPSLGETVQRWWQRWLAPIPAGALAPVLLLGLVGPPVAAAAGRARRIAIARATSACCPPPTGARPAVSSLRRGRTVDLKQVQPAQVPAGQTLFL